MRDRVLVAVVAGGLLVGAGFVTSFISAPATAEAQEEEDGEKRGLFPRLGGFFDELLDELVDDGTITQDQADAIVAAAEEKAAELREELTAQRELLRSLLEDDVLTEEEASQLPDDHWLLSDRFDEAWEDGELTRDEIGELHPRPGRAFRFGLRFGAWLDDGGIDQEEYDSLPEDHPLKQADVGDYLEDGFITPDELRELHPQLHQRGTGDDA
jgi:hypothetical protein